MYPQNMPNKTDRKLKQNQRRRIQYACKPELANLFVLINLFPPIEKWVRFDLPSDVRSPLSLIKPINWSEPSEYEWKLIKRKREMYLTGIELQVYLLSLPIAAHDSVIVRREFEKLSMFKDQFNAAIYKLKMFLEQSRKFKGSFDKAEADLVFETLGQCSKEFYEFAETISDVWFNRYRKIEQIKKLLNHLSFIGRNKGYARKDFNNLEFVDLDGLLSKIYVDEKGILHKEDNPIFKILVGVDVTRIRRCAVCLNFFWANRTDRKCCKKKCANLHNQRLSRERKHEHRLQYKAAANKKRK
jgi:hypothetical protein